jgi:hypothetical protein
VPNGDFSKPSYYVGLPPANNGFETRDLTGWTTTGAVSVVAGGPSGFYAQLSNAASVYSAPFDLPLDAQTLTFDQGFFGPNSCVTAYVLSGPTYATSTQVTPSHCASSGWSTRTLNVTQWAGQSIKVRLWGAGATGVDNVAIVSVVLDQWDVSGSPNWVPLLLPDGPAGNFASIPNAVAAISPAFVVPQGQVTVSFARRLAAGGLVSVYVRCGPTFARCGTIITNDTASPGQWLQRSASLATWQGQTVKLEFYNAGTVDLDSIVLAVQ